MVDSDVSNDEQIADADKAMMVPTSEEMLQRVRDKADELGRRTDFSSDDDANTSEHVIRVGADTNVERLAFHIVHTLKTQGNVAIAQAIGPAANQKVDLAVVAAQGIIIKHAPTQILVTLPAIRKPRMDNGEERTAIRKRIFSINSKLAQ
ncbi:MAG: stage V sporulation protein S [Methanoregulaceae archaeon]|jgi:stage V sporulation protein SpoVS